MTSPLDKIRTGAVSTRGASAPGTLNLMTELAYSPMESVCRPTAQRDSSASASFRPRYPGGLLHLTARTISTAYSPDVSR